MDSIVNNSIQFYLSASTGMRRNILRINLCVLRQADAYSNKLDYLLYENHDSSSTLTLNFST